MHYRRLGNTQFQASIIGFGAASISGEGKGYGMGPISFDDSVALVRDAFGMGINIFDTAPIYGFGTSEERIGYAVKQFREKVFIVSKSGVGWHDNGRVDMDNDPKKTQKMLEASLKRLDSDYIDLYMIHWPDKKWDIRYPLEVLAQAQIKGKIKHIGLCNTTSEDLSISREICQVSVIQSEYNLFTQQSLNDLSEMIKEMDLGFMAWGTFDKGILTGTVTKNRKFDSVDARSWAPWFKRKEVDAKIDKVETLKKHISPFSLLDMALAHNLSSPLVTTTLCGARSADQLESILKSCETQVSEELIVQAREIVND